MKKASILVSLLLLFSTTTVASAHKLCDHSEYGYEKAGYYGHHHYHNPEKRLQAKRVLNYTFEILIQAQRAARRGGYREGLGRAFAHQDRAEELYESGEYNRSIRHSLRAREIAEYIIDENSGIHPHHRRHHHSNPDDLDRSLSINIFDDNMALKFRVNSD